MGRPTRSSVRFRLVVVFVAVELFQVFFGALPTLGPGGAPGSGGVGAPAGWVPSVLVYEAGTILPIGFILCLWGSTWGLRIAAVCAAVSLVLGLVASVAMAGGGSVVAPFGTPQGFALLAIPGVSLIAFVLLMRRASAGGRTS